jgi:hypothetical protein
MPAPVSSIVFPETQEWVGTARELTAGTIVTPAVTTPVEKAEPDEKVTWLDDKSLRGSMAAEYGMVQGVEIADFGYSGPVYIDALGYDLHNLMGDYTATGSTPANSTTLTAQCSAGATTATVASIAGYASGQAVQLGVSGDGNPEIVVLSTTPSGSTLTFTNTPARFTHANGKTVATVVAPFTHVFSLLNSGNGQPVTHTKTFHQGITGSFGAAQYAYWCASDIAFTANAQQAFMHDTKGMGFLRQAATSGPVNTISSAKLQASWEALVGIGGPASGGTLVSSVIEPKVNITRNLKPYWTLSGFQSPFLIARNTLAIAGSFTHIAQDESPLTNMLNNTQPQLQILISNGLSGANLLSCQFDFQVGAYETSKLTGNDEIEYEVTWKAIANTTNVGQSGGYSPGKVTLQNAIPTY